MHLRSALHRSGLRFRVQRGVLPGVRRKVDIAFPRERVAVFVDGCFWHVCPLHGTWPKQNASYWQAKLQRNIRRDKNTNEQLEELGWHVERFWEHEDLEEAAKRIRTVILRRRTGSMPT